VYNYDTEDSSVKIQILAAALGLALLAGCGASTPAAPVTVTAAAPAPVTVTASAPAPVTISQTVLTTVTPPPPRGSVITVAEDAADCAVLSRAVNVLRGGMLSHLPATADAWIAVQWDTAASELIDDTVAVRVTARDLSIENSRAHWINSAADSQGAALDAAAMDFENFLADVTSLAKSAKAGLSEPPCAA